jgi:hypothetical protein
MRATVTSTGAGDATTRILVNELMADQGDSWIELYNPGPTTVDLSRVYLSNDRFNLLAYKMPGGAVLSPGGFWAVRQGAPPTGFSFALSPGPETVYVTAATSGAQPVPTACSTPCS